MGDFMENRIKRCFFAGAILTVILGTLSHFFYEWSGRNPAAALFFPVNESTWEHMKLLFFPMLICSLLISSCLKEKPASLRSALLAGNLLGTFLIPVLFYTYTGIAGQNYLWADIAVFILSVLAAWSIAWKLRNSENISRFRAVIFAAAVILGAAFFIFTFRVPGLPLFQDPRPH